MPVGVHVAVVDPGVGTAAPGVALGSPAATSWSGRTTGCCARPPSGWAGSWRPEPSRTGTCSCRRVVTSTFHGRDVFAPVAAHLGDGHADRERSGPRWTRPRWCDLVDPGRRRSGRRASRSVVLVVDSFGNVRIAGERDDLERPIGPLPPGRPLRLTIAATGSVVELPGATTFGRRSERPARRSLLRGRGLRRLSRSPSTRARRPSGSGLGARPPRPHPSRPDGRGPADPAAPLVEIEGLTFRYRRATEPAIRDISLTVEPGEVLLVAGPSGCGKSTLIRAINGLIPHAYPGELAGAVRIAGRSTTEHAPARHRADRRHGPPGSGQADRGRDGRGGARLRAGEPGRSSAPRSATGSATVVDRRPASSPWLGGRPRHCPAASASSWRSAGS